MNQIILIACLTSILSYISAILVGKISILLTGLENKYGI